MALIDLTDEELVHLDGKCREKVQKDVDAAKSRLAMQAEHAETPSGVAAFVADVVTFARNTGRLAFRSASIHLCGYCKQSAGYAVYPRSGRYHRKGQRNFDKPLTFPGVDLDDSFIRIKNQPGLGCCRECWEQAKPLLIAALAEVEAEIPEAITGYPPRFQRFSNTLCKKCGWAGHEGEMRQLNALMGGKYPGGCPACPAENVAFGPRPVETIGQGFTIVPRALP